MASGWVGEWSRELIRSAWLAGGRSRAARTVFHSATSDSLWGLTWLTDIRIELHASDPPSGRRRAWRVVAGADLFGLWTAHVTFGRIGAPGRTLRYEFASQAAAAAFVRSRLRRRATAIRRLGVPYLPVDASPAADQLLVLTGLRHVAAHPGSMIAPATDGCRLEGPTAAI